MQKIWQEVYINLDDSGKLTKNEKICVYGGIVFLSKKEKDKFITQYRSIISNFKCSYCAHKCDLCCPEIKNTNIKANHRRRIINYIKNYYIAILIIENDNVYEHIKESKAAKGRFLDYSIRRLIKNIIIKLIRYRKINPYLPLKIIINIDEQTTKNNGYYNLHDGIVEELKYGIINFNYFLKTNPIVYSDLEIKVSYQNSENSYVIQAADLIAGTIRRKVLANKDSFFYSDFKTIVP